MQLVIHVAYVIQAKLDCGKHFKFVMKKVNLLSKAEMKKVLGGNEPARCYAYYDNETCAYEISSGVYQLGECGFSDNGKQCRCIALDGSSSVPWSDCIRP